MSEGKEDWASTFSTAEVTSASQLNGAEISMAPMGANIRPFMRPEDVSRLKDELRDPVTRMLLVTFVSTKVYERSMKQLLDRSEASEMNRVHEVAWFAASMSEVISEALSIDGWPNGVSPPEFYELAKREMESEGYGDVT